MAATPRTQRQKEIRRHLWIYAAITPYVVLAIFPIYWMALTALKQDPDLYRMDQFPLWFHLPPTLKHFTYLFYSTNYGAWIVNTMVIAVWVAVITLLIAVILTAVIFAFTLSMQDFLYGLAFVAPGDQKPVTVGVPTELIRGDVYYWGSLMAAALMVGLPVAILYNFFLDRFIQGITGGVGK